MIPLRVNDLKQFAYCPRIVYYERVMPVDKAPTYKMERARRSEEVVRELEQRRTLARYGLEGGERRFNVWVKSERLGLSGRLDLLILAGEQAFPVDFKDSEAGLHPNHALQLAGYALMVEESLSKIADRGFVYFVPAKEIVEVVIDEPLRRQAVEALGAMRAAIARESMPEPTPHRNRCEGCEFRNYCNDVF